MVACCIPVLSYRSHPLFDGEPVLNVLRREGEKIEGLAPELVSEGTVDAPELNERKAVRSNSTVGAISELKPSMPA